MRIFRIILVAAFIWSQTSHVFPYETPTHEAVSERAAVVSTLNNFLISQLGITLGIEKPLSSGGVTRRVREWIGFGSIREDDGFRFFNHFHNPLRVWNQAGLRIFGAQLGSSSILWGQREGQGFAWQEARNAYFEALTSLTQQDRDAKLAATFHAIGNLIHLPQDAAVPAHARNDQHLFFEGFESYVEGIRPTQTFRDMILNPTPFHPSILTIPVAPLVPVARITDTTDPDQAEAVPSAGTDQGMAEYSNANFLSGDTIFRDFTHPRMASIDLANPVLLNNRRYYRKTLDGETGHLLVAEGTFTERLLSLALGDKGFKLDPVVYREYAQKLLPRAVGYSAGLIDYFFRGDIRLTAYGSEHEGSGGDITAWATGFGFQNGSSETMTGSFHILGFEGQQQQSQFNIARWDGITLAPGQGVFLCLSSFTGVCPLRPSEEYQSRPPLNVCDGPRFDPPNDFTVVFKGDLGEEQNGVAVVGKLFQICWGTE